MKKAFFETSILFEPFQKRSHFGGKSYSQAALAILKHVSPYVKKFKPVVSTSVLTECECKLNDILEAKRYKKNVKSIREIHREFINGSELVPITKESIGMTHQILEEDGRRNLKVMDVLNFSCAICSGCSNFFFIDKEMRTNLILNRIASESDMAMSPFDIPKNIDR